MYIFKVHISSLNSTQSTSLNQSHAFVTQAPFFLHASGYHTYKHVDGTYDGMMLLASFWQKTKQNTTPRAVDTHFYSTTNNENLFQTQSGSWCFGWILCSIQVVRHTSCAVHLLILSLLVNDQKSIVIYILFPKQQAIVLICLCW